MRRDTAGSPSKSWSSISSTSFSTPATTGPYSSTTWSRIAYSTASGPRLSSSGLSSSRRRRAQLRLIGSVQADPRHALPFVQELVGLFQARRGLRAAALHIDHVLDDRHPATHLRRPHRYRRRRA